MPVGRDAQATNPAAPANHSRSRSTSRKAVSTTRRKKASAYTAPYR